MKNKWLKISVITGIFLIISFFIFLIYYSPLASFLAALSLSLFVFITTLLMTSRKSLKVMADRQMKCPHCGQVIEAAFIGNKLAMELACPLCKRIITEQQAFPLDQAE